MKQWLFWILIVSAYLRFTGLNWDEGHHIHPDERFISMVAEDLKLPASIDEYLDPNHSPLNPALHNHHHFVYGMLPITLCKLLSTKLHLDNYNNFHIVGRFLSALASLVSVWLLFYIVRRYFNERAALFAAFMWGTCAISFQHAHYFTGESFLVFFTLLVFVDSLKLIEKNKWITVCRIGVWIGFAAACKLLGALALIMPMIILIYKVRAARYTSVWRELAKIVLMLLVINISAYVAFRVSHPVAFADANWLNLTLATDTINSFKEQAALMRGDGRPPYFYYWLDRNKGWFQIQNLLLTGFGSVLGVLVLAGTIYSVMCAIRFKQPALMVSIFWVFFMWGLFPLRYSYVPLRYLIHIFPFMTLFAALFIDWLITYSKKLSHVSGTMMIIGCRLALVLMLLFGAAYHTIYMRTNSRIAASQWVFANIPRGSVIGVESWDDPVPMGVNGKDSNQYYQAVIDIYNNESEDELKSQKIEHVAKFLKKTEYIILSSRKGLGALGRLHKQFPVASMFYRLLFEEKLGFKKVAEISSYPSLFRWSLRDDLAEEHLTVHDHPAVIVFQKKSVISGSDIIALLSDPVTKPFVYPKSVLGLDIVSRAGADDWLNDGPLFNIFVPFLLWFVIFQIIGWLVWPVTRKLFSGFWDEGYALAKLSGFLLAGLFPWFLSATQIASFSKGVWIWLVLAVLGVRMALCIAGTSGKSILDRFTKTVNARIHFWCSDAGLRYRLVDYIFFIVWFIFVLIRAHVPAVWWGEKPMDFGNLNSILRSDYFPPSDPWLSGKPLNYYYFGYVAVAAITQLSGLPSAFSYNLAVTVVPALVFIGIFSILMALCKNKKLALLGAIIVVFAGNLDGVRQILEHKALLPFDFWRSSRIIPYTINEFPFWTFIFADLHPHMLVMPCSMLVIASLLSMLKKEKITIINAISHGILLASAGLTNPWDFPSWSILTLLVWMILLPKKRNIWHIVIMGFLTILTTGIVMLPFLLSYQSPVKFAILWGSGATSFPSRFFIIFGLFIYVIIFYVLTLFPRNLKWVPLLFMVFGLELDYFLLTVFQVNYSVAILASVFIMTIFTYGIINKEDDTARKFLHLILYGGLGIIFFTELFGFQEFLSGQFVRNNTIFKLHLEVWLLFGIAVPLIADKIKEIFSGKSNWYWRTGFLLWMAGLFLFLSAGFIFTVMGTLVKTNFFSGKGSHLWELNPYTKGATLNGLIYRKEIDAGDYDIIRWLSMLKGLPVIVEGVGDDYTDAGRISAATGLPTIIGWRGHIGERGHNGKEIESRWRDVEEAYKSKDLFYALRLLRKYNAQYLITGLWERQRYSGSSLIKFNVLPVAYKSGQSVIYKLPSTVNEELLLAKKMSISSVELIKIEENSDYPSPGQLNEPRGIAVMRNGNVLVSDFGNNRIQEFDKELRFVRRWGRGGYLPGQFNQPCAISVGPGDDIFVADTWNNRVQVFSKRGSFKREWSGGFYGPRGIAADKNGVVFVSDTGNGRVVRFSAKGEKDLEWGTKGVAPGQFMEPVGIAVDAHGKIYVADNGNGRLQIFTLGGKFLSAFKVSGWESKVYSEPHITVDTDGVIWVTVPLSKEVRGYSNTGKLLHSIKGKDIPDIIFTTPMGIVYNTFSKELIISDLNNRVVKVPKSQ